MSDAYKGGCACGRIRYEIAAQPMAMNDCQCRHHKDGDGRRMIQLCAQLSIMDGEGMSMTRFEP